MANDSFFAHRGPDGSTVESRYNRFNIGCAGGENIYTTTATGSTADEEEFAETVVEGWMDSPGHRENILRQRFTTEGIGIAEGSYEGEQSVFVTQNFC